MKRYPFIFVTVAILVLAGAVLLPRSAASTSRAQAVYVQELEARLTALEAAAGVPSGIAYQGYLTDAGGTPLNGEHTLSFHIYDAQLDGTQKWQETHTGVAVNDGYFSVMLGQSTSTPSLPLVFSEPERWLEVRVGGVGGTPLPRQPFAAVPYALSVPAQGCRVVATVSQTIPHGGVHALEFDTAIHNVGSCWSSDEPTRLYAPVSGYYMAGGTFSLAGAHVDVEGLLSVSIRRWRGADQTHIQFNQARATIGAHSGVSVATGMFYMEAGDSIDVLAYQNLGAPKNTHVEDNPSFWQHTVNGWLVKVGN